MEQKRYIPVYKQQTGKYMHDIHSGKYSPGQQIDSINKIISKHKVSRETAKLVLKNSPMQG